MTDALAELRARIREIEGRPAVLSRAVPSGQEVLDEAVGGLPCPGLVEVCGPLGSGRTRLVLSWAAQRTHQHERVAWVDVRRVLHPPTAAALGVDLRQLVIVWPPELQLAWATEQLLRSGCFGLVVLAGAEEVAGVAARWQQAARTGRCTLVVLADRPWRGLPADLRLAVDQERAVVQRRRGGGVGQVLQVPPWPAGLDPWGEGEVPSWA